MEPTWTYWPHAASYFEDVSRVTAPYDPRLDPANVPRWARGELPGTGEGFQRTYVPSTAERLLADRQRPTRTGFQDAGCARRDAGAQGSLTYMPGGPAAPAGQQNVISQVVPQPAATPSAITLPFGVPAQPAGAIVQSATTPANGTGGTNGTNGTGEKKPLPWGWILGGGALVVAAAGGAVYLAIRAGRKGKRRGKAPAG